MLKRLSLVLLALCLLFGFAACGSAPAHESEPKPENWDMEAEVLRFLNGMNTAKTVEELRPYVLSENPDRLLEKYIAETNKILEETWQYSDVKLDYRDYTYDSVRVTVPYLCFVAIAALIIVWSSFVILKRLNKKYAIVALIAGRIATQILIPQSAVSVCSM